MHTLYTILLKVDQVSLFLMLEELYIIELSEDSTTIVSGISVSFMQATTWIAPSDVLRFVAANNINTAITDVQ